MSMTKYEITAKHPVFGEYLIGYTPRISRPGLLAAMRAHGEDMLLVLDISERDEMTWHMAPRIHARTGQWVIGFTGRTQRTVASLLDERPFVATAAKLLREHKCPRCEGQLGKVRLLRDTWGCPDCKETWHLPKRRAAA